MKKIIFSDIDGTLVDSQEYVPDYVLAYFAQIAEKCQLSFATGRSRDWVAPMAKLFKVKAPIVINNGASIIRFLDDKYESAEIIFSETFFLRKLKSIIKAAMDRGLTVAVTDETDEYPLGMTDYVRMHQADGRYLDAPYEVECWDEKKYTKVMFMDENKTNLISWLNRELAVFQKDYSITTFNDKAIEIGPYAYSKAAGIKKYAELFNVDLNDIITCGDHNNDIEMLSKIGFSIAVNNAMPEVKKAADYIASLPYGPGVVEGVKFYIGE